MSAPVDDAPRTAAAPRRERPARRRTWYLVATLAAVLLAAVLLTVRATTADHPTRATPPAPVNVASNDEPATRTADAEVVAANTRALTTMTSVQSDNTDAVLARWLGISTGPLNAGLHRSGALVMNGIRTGHVNTSGTVRKSTVSQLDPKSGTATVLALVDVRITQDGAAPSTKQDAIRTTLARTDAGWKLTAISGNTLLPH